MLVVIAGVCGSGKTSVGKGLADKLNCKFYDADDYHSIENKNLMKQGIGLNDEQRLPWLIKLHDLLNECKQTQSSCVLACSALKSKYRRLLNYGTSHTSLHIKFVLLKVDYEVVEKRLNARSHDFVKGSSILNSQFQCLETTDENGKTDFFYIVDVNSESKSVNDCITEILNNLK